MATEKELIDLALAWKAAGKLQIDFGGYNNTPFTSVENELRVRALITKDGFKFHCDAGHRFKLTSGFAGYATTLQEAISIALKKREEFEVELQKEFEEYELKHKKT